MAALQTRASSDHEVTSPPMLLFDQVAPDTPHQLGLLSGTKSESTRSLLTAMDTFLTDVSTTNLTNKDVLDLGR